MSKERQMSFWDFDGEERLNGIQEVVRSIPISSTAEITPFSLIFEHNPGFLVFTSVTDFPA
jgi:hypothetical protein